MLPTSRVADGVTGSDGVPEEQTLPGPPVVLQSDYDADTVLWADTQATALSNRDIAGLDWDHLAEEIADFGKAAKHAAWSHLRVLQMHLIMYELRPERRSNSWRMSIRNACRELQFLLAASPSLRPC